jgi:cyanophycin synthetase
VLELIESQVNTDPRRGNTELHPLSIIRIDTAAQMELERQKLTPDSVPAAGREVLIQRNANHAFDCTDEVHPDTAAIASLAARVVGLDIAGIDLVCQDIAKPLAQGGAIVEVNAGPSLLMHIKPGVGKPRPVGQAIVDNLFATNQSGRIPLVGVTGTHGKTPLPSWSPTCFTCPAHTGLACSDGLFQAAARYRRPMPPTGRPAAACCSTAPSRLRSSRTAPRSFSARAWPTTAARSASSPISPSTTKTCRAGMSSRPAASTTPPRARSTAPRSMSCCPPAMPCSMPLIRWSPTLPNCAMARSSSSPPTRPVSSWPSISPPASGASRWPMGASYCAPEPTKSASADWSTCRYIGKAKQSKNIANVLAGIAAGWALDLGKEVLHRR